MTDVGTGFLQGISAFMATRLGRASATTYHDTGSLIDSLHDGIDNNTKPAYDKLKADIQADVDLIKPIVKKIESQIAVIKKSATDSIADAKIPNFTVDTAGRISVRIATALMAIDEALRIVASELSKDAAGTVNPTLRDQLLQIWNPWVKPFQDLADGAGKVIDSLGNELLGIDHATKKLGDVLSFESEPKYRLAAQIVGTKQADYGFVRLNSTKLEAFFAFGRREFVNPSDAEKADLVERDGKWWQPDAPVFGVRVYTVINPGLQKDPLISKVMPGSKEPAVQKPTAITIDSRYGLQLGDGESTGNERVSLPVQFNFPSVEIREIALGLVRNPQKEVVGFDVVTTIAAKLGDVVGLQIGGFGAQINLDGPTNVNAMFPWAVSPRWPEQIGLRVKAGPINGGGYLERKERSYGTGPAKKTEVEFGGAIQLEILKVGVYAIGILSPGDDDHPFNLVLVMGVRFPTAIELSFGFTFNGVGGLLALNRTVDSDALVKGMKTHFIDRVLFPDDPVAEAPKLLDQVAGVFPPQPGAFVVGPIVELGWGSQAKIIEAKLGLVLVLPDPKIIILGAVRIRAPSKVTPLTDFRVEVYGEITSERLLIIASLHDSKIAGISVSGDMGLVIQWGGGGAFALSVGGFHPKYKEIPAGLTELERLTMDLSPPAVVKIIIKAYFAVTAGAVMAGVRGDLNADVGIASAHAWLQLDMIFRWVPHFGFAIDLDLGIEIDVFGCSFASISFHGSLEGTTPWKVEGKATVDVWFLPTFHLNLGPYTWGDSPAAVEPAVSPLTVVKEALELKESWKALLPLDGDQLVTLAQVKDVPGLLAHPLAVLEVTQSRLPLETHIDRVGSADVTAHRVNLKLPTTSAGDAAAVSTVKAPFAPGQFLALDGEKLLGRSGFEDLPSGLRLTPSTTPVAPDAEHGEVRWRTYFSFEHEPTTPSKFNPAMFAHTLVDHGVVNRALEERDNLYLPRKEKVNPNPADKVSILPAGAATVRHVGDGSQVVLDLGVLSSTEATRVADVLNLSGAAEVTAVAVGAI